MRQEEVFLEQVKRDLQAYFEQRYGPVLLHFDELEPQGETLVICDLAISRNELFVARFYGMAQYLAGHFSFVEIRWVL